LFLYVESPAAPQHVGGVALVDVRGLPEARPSRQDMLGLAEQMVRDLPALRRRLSPGSRWRRPRWLEQAPDLGWHVVELALPQPAGLAGLWRQVGEIAATPLPPDRPLWRVWLVHVEPGLDAVVIVLHHSIADGISGIAVAARLFRPDPGLGTYRAAAGPNRLQRAAGTVLGLAQLATDGRAKGRMLDRPMTAVLHRDRVAVGRGPGGGSVACRAGQRRRVDLCGRRAEPVPDRDRRPMAGDHPGGRAADRAGPG